MSKSLRAKNWLSSSIEQLFRDREGSSRARRTSQFHGFEPLERRDLMAFVGNESPTDNNTGGNRETHEQANRSVAKNAVGREVAVWSSFNLSANNTYEIKAQIFNETGGNVATLAPVNQTILADQRYATVAMADDGSFVVTWSGNQTGDYDIYAQRFSATGARLGTEFRVNTTTTGDQKYSRIAMDADGNFVITWNSGPAVADEDDEEVDPDRDVFFQRFDAAGNRLGGQVRINNVTAGDQSFATVAINPIDGRYTFVFASDADSNGEYEVFLRQFTAEGAQIAAATSVAPSGQNQIWADIATDGDGDFVVTWTEAGDPDVDTREIFARRFDEDADPIGSEFQVNTFSTNDQTNSTVAMDDEGNFVIVWQSDVDTNTTDEITNFNIVAQRYNFLGNRIGGELTVNTTLPNDQVFATVASDAEGNFIVQWRGFNQRGDNFWYVYFRRFEQVRPDANDDEATTRRETPVRINVLANDRRTSPGGNIDPTSVIIVNPPGRGTAIVNADGSITYTPEVGYIGPDFFTYVVADTEGTFSLPATVSITVTGIPPVAVNDSASTNEDTPVLIDILANDTPRDRPIAPGTVTIKSGPTNGTVSVNPTTGVVTYTPGLNFNGTASFTYTVKDTSGGESNIATVTITIAPVNDRPVANDDSATTNRGVPITINVLANDTDVDSAINPASVVIVTPPPAAAGTLSVNPTTGAITYTPAAAFFGSFTFTYKVSDAQGLESLPGTVSIRVNNPPVAVNDSATTPEDVSININVLSNDTDVDGTLNPATVVIVTPPTRGTATVNPVTGVVTYTPTSNLNGPDSFTYQVRDNDGALSNVATVSINVLAVNDPPVAVNDPTVTDIDTTVVINILANDTDVDNAINPASVVIVSGPTNGSITINPATGAITYTPNAGYAGADLIQYTVKDVSGAVSNVADVTIRVGLPSTISGRVYVDRNNNGSQQGDEGGLPGISIALLKTDGPVTFVINTTTAADGTYAFTDLFPGIYTLVQTQPGVFLDGRETPAPGVPVGSIVNDQFRDIQIGSGVNAAGFNFGERGIRAEFLASYSGARIFLASASLAGGLSLAAAPAAFSLAAGDIWVSIDGGWNGRLAFTATPLGGTAGLTLYDNNLNAVASAVPTTGTAGFEFNGTAGNTYFLRINGTSTNVDVDAFNPTPAPVNQAPVLNPIGNRNVVPGQVTSFIVRAVDPNAGDTLRYALAGPIPAGAAIDQTTGLFTWAVPANFTGKLALTILVQDNGNTVLSDFETFEMGVGSGNNGSPTMTQAEAQAFVRSLYVDLLGRQAEAEGLNFHTARLMSGISREIIVSAFTSSSEYYGRIIDGMYSQYLRRRADAAGRAVWVQRMVDGLSENAVTTSFVTSGEYLARRASNSAFVDGLYRDILGRAPDAAGLATHSASLQRGTSRAALTATFLGSQERIDRVITEQYGYLLGRAADAAARQSYRALLTGAESAAQELADLLLDSNEYLARAVLRFR